MNEPTPSTLRDLPVELVRQVEAICSRFEDAWAAGGRPALEEHLAQAPAGARAVLLAELLRVELSFRRQAGEAPAVTDYRRRFAQDAAQVDAVFHERGDDLPGTRPAPGPDADGKTRAPAGPQQAVTFPGFDVLGLIGTGGMGVVYRAWQAGLRRVVALKALKAEYRDSPERLARFRVEAEAMARLQHPNIVTVYEVGGETAVPFLVMEYVEGGSLAARLTGTPLPPREAAGLLETVARAVEVAHGRRILHRDLTPANVLLGVDGTPKISDFGLAKLLSGGQQLTQTEAIMGTPSYMAPEQAEGKARELTPACDVYALGAILYECLTGRPPFKAATPLETILQVVSDEPVPPRYLLPAVPRDLDTVCLKCLQKDPRWRYESAGALADDLRRFLDGKPIAARPVSVPARVWRWSRRNPAVASLLAAVVLLLVVLTGGALVKNAQLAAALRDSEAKRWESLRDQARAMRMSRHPGQRVASLKAIQEATQLPLPPGHSLDELRTEAIAALALPDVEVLQEREGWPAGTVGLDFDGNLERYARLATDGTVSVRRVSDDAEVARWQEQTEGAWPESESNLRFSPDGRFLCIRHSASGRLTVRRLDGPEPSICYQGTKANGDWAMDFSPDGKQLAYELRNDTRIAVVDLASEEVRYLPPTGAEDQHYIQFAPDGRRFSLSIRRAGIWAVEVLDAATGQVQRRLAHPMPVTQTAWHPDGQTVATCCDDHLIRLWDLASGRLLRVLEGHKTLGIRCAFNHTGDRLVSNDWNNTLRIWEPSSGRQLLSFSAAGYSILRVSSDDHLLAYHASGGAKLQLLRLHAGLEYCTIGRDGSRSRDSYHDNPKVHPGGRLLAVTAMDDSMVLIDLAAGREVAALSYQAGEGPLL
jgi:tRNA A-37 threonylcarbamoyl transferase component Bud32